MDFKWNQWVLNALFLLAGVAEATVFDVKNYGAQADGMTDISKALVSAWNDSCASVEPTSTVLISRGTYLLGPVILSGPCKSSSIEFQLQGLVRAPPDPALFKTDAWVLFENVKGLKVSGGGILDGQGQRAWTSNNCSANPNCKELPINLKLAYVQNTIIRDIASKNSKYFHIGIFQSSDLTLENLNIYAPGSSPNTDGIHMSSSERINVTNIVIATGDDCISIGPGTRNLNVTKVVCGPGHGISIGSLGKSPGEAEVHGIFVRNCTFTNTLNGARIKTWPSSPVGAASNIVFEDLIMNNAYFPVILDQMYCPHQKCDQERNGSKCWSGFAVPVMGSCRGEGEEEEGDEGERDEADHGEIPFCYVYYQSW
ncbi:hypothetical protein NE237_031553 [Protea cynaroides]|uniref:Polygalacturonase n=1 Tax=Protea cynaroides TaxID=273540 RepID=A0A9Q0L2B5_9MAGN|nr:hypothetical protein NE237_031553 [Protea cynaroides]